MATKVGILKFGQDHNAEPFKRIKKVQALLLIRQGLLEWIVKNRIARELAVKVVKDSDPDRFLIPVINIVSLPVRLDDLGLLLQYPLPDQSSNRIVNRRRIWGQRYRQMSLYRKLMLAMKSQVLHMSWYDKAIETLALENLNG